MTFKYLPNNGHITSLRGNRLHPNTKKWTMHQGVDFSGVTGDDNIIAVGNGRVRIAEKQSGYGNVIVITHPATKATGNVQFETLYAHLRTIDVVVGQEVVAGQIIAQQGNTGLYGNSKHLHFEMFIPKFSSDFSTAVDPLLYISSPQITDIQVKLKRTGEDIEIDGYFGKDTRNAIKRFQKNHNLEIDGFCGTNTSRVLDSVLSEPPTPEPNQVASDHKPIDTLTYSSPTLKHEVDSILQSKSKVEQVVKYAIENGANEEVWMDKLNNHTYENDDILGLAVKAIVNRNK